MNDSIVETYCANVRVLCGTAVITVRITINIKVVAVMNDIVISILDPYNIGSFNFIPHPNRIELILKY